MKFNDYSEMYEYMRSTFKNLDDIELFIKNELVPNGWSYKRGNNTHLALARSNEEIQNADIIQLFASEKALNNRYGKNATSAMDYPFAEFWKGYTSPYKYIGFYSPTPNGFYYNNEIWRVMEEIFRMEVLVNFTNIY